MRTYTHGIIGYLIYIKGSAQQKKLAVLGAMMPDLILAIGYIFHFAGQSPVVQTLHNFFHRSLLHSVTELMHSFILVIPLLVLSYFFYKTILPFFVGMLSHVILDLLTHQTSLYNHLYPLPFQPIASFVSYTSFWFTIIEHLFILIFVIWFLRKNGKILWRKFKK
ncbi:metal-dependent hydrolase [Candidatus Woesearchaeota archaeon]|nr:metal-dependent hydrolase [Candidatus Woesearchaeota archaeon]